VKALIGILLIGFGIVLFARTVGQIMRERRRREARFAEALRGPVPTVLPDQTEEWAAYVPPVRLARGSLAYTVDDGRNWMYGDDGWTEVLPDATPRT